LAKPLCKEKTQHLHKHHRNVGFHSSTQPTEKRFVLVYEQGFVKEGVGAGGLPIAARSRLGKSGNIEFDRTIIGGK
jgi:hypothetical protein